MKPPAELVADMIRAGIEPDVAAAKELVTRFLVDAVNAGVLGYLDGMRLIVFAGLVWDSRPISERPTEKRS